MIVVKLNDLLREQEKSLYGLAQETGIAYSNLHALAAGKTTRADFGTLAAICAALNCEPGDVLVMEKPGRKSVSRKAAK